MSRKEIGAESLLHDLKMIALEHREIIVYGIVGVMTTAVSWFAAFFLKLFLDDQIVWQNAAVNTLS